MRTMSESYYSIFDINMYHIYHLIWKKSSIKFASIQSKENGLNNCNESNNEELESEESYSCEKPSNE